MKSKLPELLNKVNKDDLISFYNNHSKVETAEHFGLNISSLSILIKHFDIRKDKSLIVERRKRTCLEKYGVDVASKSEAVKKKISKNQNPNPSKAMRTKLERYGDPNYNNIFKNAKTKLEKYGDPTYNNREKCKQTCLYRYGVENPYQIDKVKDTIIDKMFDKKDYSEIFRPLVSDRDKSIEFLFNKDYTYKELADLFNCPYYTVQNWVYRLDLKDYVKYSFDGRSSFEDDIIDFLDNIGIINIVKNYKLDNGQEIDIFIPDHNIGIECNGDYWHSDLYKTKKYHQDKSLFCQSHGIRLIHIFEYEWYDCSVRPKIESLISISVGKVKKRIYARNCCIKEITNKEAKLLNDSVHLQNHRDAKITYGLFYKDELVQLMSFSKHKTYEWEIIRGCPGSNNIVVGGVDKLFKHFIKENNPSSIFSYCDFNKFDGRSYEKIGMTFIGYTQPDLKYKMKDGTVVNRNPNKYKEHNENCECRIYGAGSKKYVWNRCD